MAEGTTYVLDTNAGSTHGINKFADVIVKDRIDILSAIDSIHRINFAVLAGQLF